ncbi:MAG: YedE-related selenium metabolism membrane protein [Firmicutes bacterium]|nr:YedE-related selenium metabolism membrane protein [Bacillota bacterium]
MNQKKIVLGTGALIGALSVILVVFGNPTNMGACIACFIRDIAGGLGLHRAGVVQYIRPEIPGFILGSMLIALMTKEFQPRGGSSPLVRFILGFFMMIGALVFLGCPLRMVLRLAAGDLNALVGLAGFAAGIWVGLIFVKKGFTLGRSHKLPVVNGLVLPSIAVVLLGLVVVAPAFIFFSTEGPGSRHAPLLLSLLAGIIIGIMAQRSRLCMAGGIRDLFLIKDAHLFIGFVAIFAVALVLNLTTGSFQLGFENQPIAHNDGLWNFLGMFLVGYAAVLLGGCPLRQCILAGEGDTDAAITFLGMLVGAAFAHNFSLAASTAGGGVSGQVAVVLGIIVASGIGYAGLPQALRNTKQEVKGHVIHS